MPIQPYKYYIVNIQDITKIGYIDYPLKNEALAKKVINRDLGKGFLIIKGMEIILKEIPKSLIRIKFLRKGNNIPFPQRGLKLNRLKILKRDKDLSKRKWEQSRGRAKGRAKNILKNL